MKRIILALLFAVPFHAVQVTAQTINSSLETYLEKAKTIIIGRCLSVGPVNILLRAHVQFQILHVVKGKEVPRTILVDSQYDMKEGTVYLLSTEHDATTDHNYFRVDTIESAIPIGHSEEIDVLKNLSPRIIVLRTMNRRVDELESEIRRKSYELEALKLARRENSSPEHLAYRDLF